MPWFYKPYSIYSNPHKLIINFIFVYMYVHMIYKFIYIYTNIELEVSSNKTSNVSLFMGLVINGDLKVLNDKEYKFVTLIQFL